MSELLRCVGLSLRFAGAAAPLLREVDLSLSAGEAVALSGPSGGGKTMLARALLGLLPAGVHRDGRLLWEGEDPADARDGWVRVRGCGISWLPQEPLGGLNPLLRVGAQVAESARLAGAGSPAAARRVALDLLAELQMPDPERAFAAWPHQLSGGMRQRALLAAVLARGPRLLVADEPTSSLDTSVQRDLLAVLDRARRARGLSLLFITHDRDLAMLVAGRRLEIRDGRVAAADDDPAPRAAATPWRSGGDTSRPAQAALVATAVSVRYPGSRVDAVAGVDLELRPGRAVGLVGESGSGKTTLVRALAGHLAPGAGDVTIAGGPLPGRQARRRVQMLFQDAGASLNPRQKVGDALREAAAAAGGDERDPVPRLLAEVGLPVELAGRHPHALSGGQRQRVALARCLAAAPEVLVADEPTSALDAASRDRILALLGAVMASRGLALLLVTHDLDIASAFCDEIMVMHAGRIVERAPASALASLRHPHARRLLQCRPAALAALPQWQEIPPREGSEGAEPGAAGCPLAGACPLQNASCFKELPPLAPLSPGHWLRCPPASELPPPQFIDTL